MRATNALIPYIDLTRDGGPLYRQLYHGLREAIVRGRLPPASRLPSTRAMAEDLDVARMTVMRAYRQLRAEGYVRSGVGSGTWIESELPDHLVRAPPPGPGKDDPPEPDGAPALSSRGSRLVDLAMGLRGETEPVPFMLDPPDTGTFPRRVWQEMEAEIRRASRPCSLPDRAGAPELRRALADFVSVTRGGGAHPSRVVVTSGGQESLSILAELLLDPSDSVLVEDPGHPRAARILDGAAETVPVPVDDEGMVVVEGVRLRPGARAAYVTPSHQFPLGSTMSRRRREELLRWAAKSGSWILEDDRDSQYRFEGRPLPSLQSLDRAESVIYLGSFGRSLFPVLPLAFVILPERLVEPFLAVRSLRVRPPPTRPQRTLARFLREGHYARHIRRSRRVFLERRDALLTALSRHLGRAPELSGTRAGTRIVLWLPAGLPGTEAADRASAAGLVATPVGLFSRRPLERHGLVLGYGAFETDVLEHAAVALSKALR
ncbi:MAG: PLP-dependent aminotransferase family protein [Gemmatimonadota bacterium]|jgi:GntR family transcriptional regulator/MocR family aminotransferase